MNRSLPQRPVTRTTWLGFARYSAFLIPLFGLFTSLQLGCELEVAEDIGSRSSSIARKYGPGYGPGYGSDDGYGYGYGYDSYGYGYDGNCGDGAGYACP